ncbi:protein FAM83A [Megalops cyprinoides]|uniref:protein FAM83A n=1 Tax=Megalops cyprinoides TaxID=118141 RepID=UPI001864BFF6|nr:protein FAM83A [Megalops cyprinoides]
MSLRSGVLSVGWYLNTKQVGKVRRRVQEMRYPSSPLATEMDLSHNESARLATDALLDRGLVAYQEALAGEGEVDFLSKEEKGYILRNAQGPADGDEGEGEPDQEGSSETYFPAKSESEPLVLEQGWPVANWGYHLQGKPNVEVCFQSDRSTRIKDLLRECISKATTLLAIVMDTFTDVEILCDILEATRKRCVSVYLLLDHVNLHLFVEMCENLQINSSHLTKMSIRSVCGETYCAKSGRKFTGQIKEKFVIIDCTQVLAGSFSFTWLSWHMHRSLAVLFKGSAIKPFDLEFRRLYADSKPVAGFPTATIPQNPALPSGLGQHPPLLAPPRVDRASPHPTAQPKPHETTPTSPLMSPSSPQVRVTQQTYLVLPSAHWVPQRHVVSRPVVRQSSFSSDCSAGNLSWSPLNLVHGGVRNRPNGLFPRHSAGFHFLNKPGNQTTVTMTRTGNQGTF